LLEYSLSHEVVSTVRVIGSLNRFSKDRERDRRLDH
jgi:hypothetical protein